jgi:hypothetical protein
MKSGESVENNFKENAKSAKSGETTSVNNQ